MGRLQKLEHSLKPSRRIWFLWRELGDTVQEAKARHLAEHPETRPTDCLFIIQWHQDAERGECDD